MRRQRTLHPRGIAFSFTLITSFHPFFVTGMDRAFSIRCFFLESIKGLNAEIDVGTLSPQNVDQEYSLPVCAYHLKDGIEGHVLRFAQVGQKVTHLWRCDQDASHVYGILIHSCYADDGHGNKFELVDDRGCSTDPFLLPQINYEASAISAYTNAHVFKYADKIQLYFTCTVQLCYKHDGGCEGITPPSCAGHGVSTIKQRENSLDRTLQQIDEYENEKSIETSPRSMESQPNDHESTRIPGYIKPDSFNPIILGPPNPPLFPNERINPSKAVPFQGPKDLRRIGEGEISSAYRRDSPLNDTTDDEIVMKVITLRTTIPTLTHTPELVTFKPMSTIHTPTYHEKDLNTPRIFGRSTPAISSSLKTRQTSGDMETDVSVDVIVLPVETKERKDTNVSPQSLSFQSPSEVCLSKTSTIVFSMALILTLIFSIAITFLVTRQRNRRFLEDSKRHIENF